MCVCACVCVCVRACVCACVCVVVEGITVSLKGDPKNVWVPGSPGRAVKRTRAAPTSPLQNTQMTRPLPRHPKLNKGTLGAEPVCATRHALPTLDKSQGLLFFVCEKEASSWLAATQFHPLAPLANHGRELQSRHQGYRSSTSHGVCVSQ